MLDEQMGSSWTSFESTVAVLVKAGALAPVRSKIKTQNFKSKIQINYEF